MADRPGLVLGARLASGAVAAAIALGTVLVVGLVPFPRSSAAPRALEVDPAPAAQLRVCPGAAVRIGDAAGGSADAAFAIGAPAIGAAVRDGELERVRLAGVDEAAGPAAVPELVRVPPAAGALVAGAQSQRVDAPDFVGLTAAACAEPTGSTWLVGGATTVGRSTFLLLANPTDVPARVSLEIFGEEGAVTAPGMAGIDVPAGEQVVLSLAGFAPGLRSPIVHVTARGGRVVATLQQSLVRGLDAVGVDAIGGGADPATELVIPGVRILDALGVSRASALPDWQDVGPVIRLAAPGDADAEVLVRVQPTGEGAGTSFPLRVPAGTVVDVPLDSAEPLGEHTEGLPDGLYTVFVSSDVPIVAGVRASTAVAPAEGEPAPDSVLTAPPSDLAWFSAASPLDGATLLVVPDGPAPVLTLAAPGAEAAEVELTSLDGSGEAQLVDVPAGGAVGIPLAPGRYLLAGSEGLVAGVSLAGPGELAALVLAPPRPVAGPIVVRPD